MKKRDWDVQRQGEENRIIGSKYKDLNRSIKGPKYLRKNLDKTDEGKGQSPD